MSRIRIGVQLHPQHTSYADFAAAVRRAEDLGVDTIWNWDHFYPLYGEKDGLHFEGWTLLTALAVVLGDTLRRADRLSAMLGFRAPLGFFILGLGVLQMLISAPFDDWWHRVYGVDVSVWSPPHLIGFSGAVVMLCGVIIATTSERRRALLLSPRQERAIFLLLALLLALVVRWITFQ